MTRVAIIAAMEGELSPLVRGWRRESRAGVDLWRLVHGDGEWIAACAGIGSVAAGRAFAEAERGGALGLAVSVGWAGALSGEFAAGRAYRVSGVIDAGTGERFAAGPGTCWLVTSTRVAGREEKRRLGAAHGAGLVDMEAAGVARLAAARGIPFRCVKGVSDGPSDRLPDFDAFLSAEGGFLWARFAGFALLRPWLWPALARMGGASREAARAIAESLHELLDPRGAVHARAGRPEGARTGRSDAEP